MSVKMKSMRIALTLAFLLIVGSLSAQTVQVNVKDATGEAVIGASVIEQGTQNGGVTDFDGNFTIKLTAGKPIVISYIGMKSQTINAAGKSSINVVLQEDATTLNDVVVIGYGSVRKKDLTGSVATVNSDALVAVPVANATEALTGKMAGVQITTTEGSPDAEMKIRVRGGGSITGDNTPLFIVDGFPVESISDIPASDIEDITVLKDASSTAIYGSRGANGVILVTTKSGQAGKVKVNYNAFYSWKKMAKQLNLVSGSDYIHWQREHALINGSNSQYTDKFGSLEDIDLYENANTNNWQDQIFGRTGHTFNHNLSITGGSENTTYAFNYAHVDDKAIMVGSSFKRDNLSLKLKHKIGKKITLDFSMRYANTKVNGAGMNESKAEVSSSDSRLKDVMLYPPFMMSEIADGYDQELNLINPWISIKDNDRFQKRQTFDMNGAFTWQIFKNFQFKSEFGLQHYYNNNKRFYGTSTYWSRDKGQNLPMATFEDTNRKSFRNTNTISYDFKDVFGKDSDHSLNILLGQEMLTTKSNVTSSEIYHYPLLFGADEAWRLSSQGEAMSTPDYYINADDNLFSFFARANYNYKDKYLVSATFRADGSSKFGKGNRWGYFPSAAIAWRISSEPFMEKTKSWLDDLKLRFSYGTAGNNNIPSGQNSVIWSSTSSNVGTWINGYESKWTTGEGMANPDLTWETTITRNIGLDFTLFGSKLTASIEYYWNSTKDLLLKKPTPGTGYSYQYQNLGETRNKGFELSLTYNAINKKDFGLSFSGNIGFNKNKVVDLGGLPQYADNSGWASTQIASDYIVKEGHPVGEIYGYLNDGRYEVDDFESFDGTNWILKPEVADATNIVGTVRPGTMKIASTEKHWDATQNAWVWNSTGLPENENGEIATNELATSDKTVIGDTNPVATGGFAINARAYGFDFAANFTFSIGNDIYNANKIEFTTASPNIKYRNMLDIMAEGSRWTNYDPVTGELCNDKDRLSELNVGTTMWSPHMKQNVLTNWAIENGSFLRLSTLTLGYTLPQNLMKKIGINSLRFYFTCYNVFCITGYSGYDPEVSTRTRTPLTPGVDYSAYPKSRQYVIGLNLNF